MGAGRTADDVRPAPGVTLLRRAVAVMRAPVELGAFLKLAGAVSTGGEAKRLVQGGEVKVNGVVERRRRRALVRGDVVQVGWGDELVVEPAGEGDA